MNMRFLGTFAWVLWSVLLVVLLYGLVLLLQDVHGRSSPEATSALGFFVFAVLLCLLVGAGGLLYWFKRRGSRAGVIVMTIILAYPVVGLVANPAIIAYRKWRFERMAAAVGDFKDPVLQALAQAIRTNDNATLKRLLDGRPAPIDKDRAGNDLLAYGLIVLRDHNGSIESVRTLLDAGIDPRLSKTADGADPINFIIGASSPGRPEALRLLLQHGADPNAVDPRTGDTPIRDAGHSLDMVRALVDAGADIDRIQRDGLTAVVNFVSNRHWESALYLVELGARLDVHNDHGVSLDYYLKEWQESVYGDHPEGWHKVREAIAKRRGVIR